MARVWKLVVGVACACVCGVARADVVKLADLEARALSQRPEVAASAARVNGAAAEIDAAKSTYYPQVSATLDGTLAPGRALIPYEAGGKDYLIAGSQTLSESGALRPQPRYGANVAARGTLYDFGRTRSALDAARAKQRASEADASARAQVLVLEIRAAYLRWAVAQELWGLTKQAEAESKARADRVAGLIAEGAAPPSAATSASAQANAAASESERAELELETARLELGYLSTRDLGPDALPEPSLLAVASQPSAAGATGATNATGASLHSGAVGPLALRLEQPRSRADVTGDAELAAKYAQPAAAGGAPPGPSGNLPAAAPAIAPPTVAAPAVTTPATAPAGATLPATGQATTGTTAPGTATPAAASAPASAATSGALQPSAASPTHPGSPQLQALETARAAAEAARRVQSRLTRPALAYRVSAGIDGQDEHLFPMFGIGIGLTVPLWDGGATSAAEAGARAAEAELSAELDAERARDKHVRERRNVQAQHADRLLALAETAVALAETRVQQLKDGPTLGTAEQEALAAAEAERAKARAELVKAKAARVQLQLGL
jgi:outer membrane protein TolC